MKNDITVIFVSFHSEEIIEKSIATIDQDIQIIVVENSRNLDLKTKLEKKYTNIKVVVPDENLGNGAGINFGLKNTKTKYALYLDVDTELYPDTIKNLILAAREIKRFSILAPKIKNFEYRNDCYIESSDNKKYSNMRFVTGCALFFDLKLFGEVGFFDEKIFLYFEENDFYERCIKRGKKIILVNDSIIIHKGNASVNPVYKDDVEINRNWHLMWSTFYFYKKHFGVFTAYKKILPKLFSAVLNILFYTLIFKRQKRRIYLARFSGLLNSIMGNKSWFRPNLTR